MSEETNEPELTPQEKLRLAQIAWADEKVAKNREVSDYTEEKPIKMRVVDWKPDNCGNGVWLIVREPHGKGRKPKGFVYTYREIYREFPDALLPEGKISMRLRVNLELAGQSQAGTAVAG